MPFSKIWQAHQNIDYIKRRIIPKSSKALAVIMTGVRIFCHFHSFFIKILLKAPSHKSVAMET